MSDVQFTKHGKPLAQSRLANTTATIIYTPQSGLVTRINEIWITNTTTSTAKCRLFNDISGSTMDESTALLWDIAVNGEETYIFDGGIYVRGVSSGFSTAGSIGFRTDTNNAFTITIYGEEVGG